MCQCHAIEPASRGDVQGAAVGAAESAVGRGVRYGDDSPGRTVRSEGLDAAVARDEQVASNVDRHAVRHVPGAHKRAGFGQRKLDPTALVANAELGGTVQLWAWIGDDGATTFSY